MFKKNNNKYENLISQGIKSANNKDFKKSKSVFLQAIDTQPIRYEAYINLSNIYILENKSDKCIKILTNYLLTNKFNENIANYLGKICLNYNKKEDLKKLFQISNLNFDFYEKEKKYLFYLQGIYFEQNREIEKAKKSFSQSIFCDYIFYKSYEKIFNLLEETNDIKKLKFFIKLANKNFKNENQLQTISFYKAVVLNRENKFKKSNDILSKLTNHPNKNLYFYLKILDLQIKNSEKLNMFKETFSLVKVRNDIVYNLQENDIYKNKNIIKSIKQYKKFYIKKNVLKIHKNTNSSDDSKLVFLIGFPRSGTTLLDTILRTHSNIEVLEEKPYLLDLRHDYFKKNDNNLLSILNISRNEKDYIRKEYFNNALRNIKNEDKIIVDKFPLSIIELGFINCIFPNAKIISALRNPCDVVLSCFFSSFKINEAMINFLKLQDTVNFYNEVQELFEFYKKELNLNLITIKYENLVLNFEEEVKSLLNFLDLKYEKKLEEFYITAQKRDKISTPSYVQVIKPLYSSSIGRWKNYQEFKYIVNNLEKWTKQFNY